MLDSLLTTCLFLAGLGTLLGAFWWLLGRTRPLNLGSRCLREHNQSSRVASARTGNPARFEDEDRPAPPRAQSADLTEATRKPSEEESFSAGASGASPDMNWRNGTSVTSAASAAFAAPPRLAYVATPPSAAGVNPHESQSPSWAGRELFRGFGSRAEETGEETNIPPVDAAELPHAADGHDFVFGSLTPVLAALLPESKERRAEIEKELRAAGNFRPHAWHNLAAIRYVAMVVPLLIFGAMLVVAPRPLEVPAVILLVTSPLLGWAVPRIYVKNRASIRTAAIERAMPDMLDMLTMCVSQGLTVSDSLDRVRRRLGSAHPDLAHELSIICEQARVGTLTDALEAFSDRIDVSEVHSFASLLTQTERMGTSVADALTEHSDNLRESLRQRADEKANRAAFKLLFPTVLCLMPAVYLVLLGPAVVELAEFFDRGGGSEMIEAGQRTIEQMNEDSAANRDF